MSQIINTNIFRCGHAATHNMAHPQATKLYYNTNNNKLLTLMSSQKQFLYQKNTKK